MTVSPLPDDRIGFFTRSGVHVTRRSTPCDSDPIPALLTALNDRRGAYFACISEFPGRYRPGAIGFVDPPLAIEAHDGALSVKALNKRGTVLLAIFRKAVLAVPGARIVHEDDTAFAARLIAPVVELAEEERTRRPSLFTLLRALQNALASEPDPHLGFYGAFGYDLVSELEPVQRKLARKADERSLVLYLPDELVVVDAGGRAVRHRYYFSVEELSTADRAGGGLARQPDTATAPPVEPDPATYIKAVEQAREAFAAGDMFEVVLSQTFARPAAIAPAQLYQQLTEANPAPYTALMNLGEGEYLVSASPEMFVRVTGRRVETCPISGTVPRGANALQDAENTLALLNSGKEESELTMCTDVDRNDKARVCVPGSVRIIGRRQIELYSRVIHTVDHVEGMLKPDRDAFDAFLSHAWAVTVTGAPKAAAIQFIEDHEADSRAWYGGAFGFVGANGDMDTGLTLRTVRLKNGIASVRAGATLLFASDPVAEEAETRLKASAMLAALEPALSKAKAAPAPMTGTGKKVLLVDHRDSFALMLADYFRQTGAEVITLRPEPAREAMARLQPDLVVLSPGPGRPEDFNLSATIAAALQQQVPIFGVCLGLQGLVEHFGGKLGRLDLPMHGRATTMSASGGKLFAGLPQEFQAGRYHSLYGAVIPDDLVVTARSDDGIVMAVEHRTLPIGAVQFHPESLMTLQDDIGHRLLDNVMRMASREPNRRRA